ncbi:MAG: NUDIX domain-containing protein [Vicinamibacteria bacterium]|nr:NUDIX domain-containing protein [Vicinamibacteria bacterium]
MNLAAILSAHQTSEPREEEDRARILRFARAHPDPFDRTIREGHCTGSGLVMSEDGSAVLLLHHEKLQRWLQPGGHGERGETRGEDVASREVAEETGLDLRLHPTAPRPFDVDIHKIPARKQDPEHEHLDLRYLFVADPSERVRVESPQTSAPTPPGPPLRWFRVQEALAMDIDPGLKRMIRKATVILESRG